VDVEGLVEDLKRAGKGADGQQAVRAVLERAVSEPGALLGGIGEPLEAGIHTLYRAPDLTVLNVVWAPLMVLLPHNHKMWATIGIYTGREDNILWRSAGTRVGAFGAASLSAKDVFDLPDDAIHSVVNPIPRLTGAIHVYGGDFFAAPRSEWDSDTLSERPFDLEAARRVFQEAARRFNCQ
jgi:predicted metal-dependent enzyme (double-stranded beta helix superfamily)